MGSACSTPPEAEKETTTSVVPAAQPTKQVVAKHSIKHGGATRGNGNWLSNGPCTIPTIVQDENECRRNGRSSGMGGGMYTRTGGSLQGTCIYCDVDANLETGKPCLETTSTDGCHTWRYVDTEIVDSSGNGRHLTVDRYQEACALSSASALDDECVTYQRRRYHGTGFGSHTDKTKESLNVGSDRASMPFEFQTKNIMECMDSCRTNPRCAQATYDAKDGTCSPGTTSYDTYEEDQEYTTFKCAPRSCLGGAYTSNDHKTTIASSVDDAARISGGTILRLADVHGTASISLELNPTTGALSATMKDRTSRGIVSQATSNTFPRDSVWVHVAAIFSSVGTSLMIDGETVGHDARPATPSTSLFHSSSSLSIGTASFRGDVDAVAIWRGRREVVNIHKNIFNIESDPDLYGIGLDFTTDITADPDASGLILPRYSGVAARYGKYEQVPSNRGYQEPSTRHWLLSD